MNLEGLSRFLPISAFIGYFLLTYIYALLKNRNVPDTAGSSHGLQLLNVRHFIGIFLFGLMFALCTPQFLVLFRIPEKPDAVEVGVTALLCICCGLLAVRSARSRNPALCPEVMADGLEVLKYLFVRTGFLISYEFYFRGVLLYACVAWIGLGGALFINLAAYILIHLFDNREELLGTLIFGPVLCLLVIWTESIWPAVLLHLSLSLPFEGHLLYRLTRKTKIL